MLRLLLGLLGLIAGVLAYYAWLIEPYRLIVRRRVFAVAGLDPSREPITILHLSDLHMRKGERRKVEMLEPLKTLQPDLIVITGDFVQSTEDARYCADVLSKLQARHGIFGVLGNHDHYRYSSWNVFRRTRRVAKHRGMKRNDSSEIVQILESAGIRILRNSNIPMRIHGQEIWLVGIDDCYHHLDDLPKALSGVPSHAPKILLSHSPDILNKAAVAGIDIILSGHTHGGQVLIPFIGAVMTRTRQPLERPSGVINRNGTTAHISPGIGGGTLTLRFLCPPEATIIELRPAAKAMASAGILGRRQPNM